MIRYKGHLFAWGNVYLDMLPHASKGRENDPPGLYHACSRWDDRVVRCGTHNSYADLIEFRTIWQEMLAHTKMWSGYAGLTWEEFMVKLSIGTQE